MNNGIKATSPLDNMATVHGENIQISENSLHGKVTIRIDCDNKTITDKVKKIVGLEMPSACTFNEDKNNRLIWIGPNELMFYCSIDKVDEYIVALKGALKSHHHAVVDVSDYYITLRLQGASARALLNSECPLDLHPSAFKKGDSAGTLFAHANILLNALDKNIFDIQVRWSFADYLMAHLADGSKFYNIKANIHG